MPKFIQAIPIAICDRCHRKYEHWRLQPDGNVPGLRVCAKCRDNIDPYRLPTHQVERIAVQFPRPDTPLSPGYYVTGASDAAFIVWPGNIVILVEPQP